MFKVLWYVIYIFAGMPMAITKTPTKRYWHVVLKDTAIPRTCIHPAWQYVARKSPGVETSYLN